MALGAALMSSVLMSSVLMSSVTHLSSVAPQYETLLGEVVFSQDTFV
jgi:hypothetical protein